MERLAELARDADYAARGLPGALADAKTKAHRPGQLHGPAAHDGLRSPSHEPGHGKGGHGNPTENTALANIASGVDHEPAAPWIGPHTPPDVIAEHALRATLSAADLLFEATRCMRLLGQPAPPALTECTTCGRRTWGPHRRGTECITCYRRTQRTGETR